MKKISLLLGVAICVAVAATCGGNAVAASRHDSRQSMVQDSDWPNYGGDGSEQHYSPLQQISLDNVEQLEFGLAL